MSARNRPAGVRGDALPEIMDAALVEIEAQDGAARRRSVATALRSFAAAMRELERPIQIDATSVAAWERWMARPGGAPGMIGHYRTLLRAYARVSGDGRDWALGAADAKLIGEEALPSRMRRALAAIERSPLAPRRRAISGALRSFVTATRALGLKDRVTGPAVEAWTRWLIETRGRTPKGVEPELTALRRYAELTDEGADWAVASQKRDLRPIPKMLQAPHWRDLHDVAALLVDAGAPSDHLKVVDRWLAGRALLPAGPAARADVEVFLARTRRAGPTDRLSFRTAHKLATTLALLDPLCPDLRAIEEVRFRLGRASASGKRSGGGKPLEFSVPLDTLPPDWRRRIAEARRPPRARREEPQRRRGRRAAWSDAMVLSVVTPVRQLLRVARDQGLPEAIDEETVEAYCASLDDRGVSPRACESYLRGLAAMAALLDLDFELQEAIRGTADEYREEAEEELKRKAVKLSETPLTLNDIFQRARNLAAEAPVEAKAHARRGSWLCAAGMAILSVKAFRARDLNALVLGDETARAFIKRDAGGWRFRVQTSKTKKVSEGRLPDRLTPLLDAAILLGADPTCFWSLYEARCGRPFFSHPDGRRLSLGWFYRRFAALTGHSPHIVRTLVHDELARKAGGQRQALLLCDQSFAGTADDYRVAAERVEREQAMADLAAETEDDRAPPGATPW